MKRSTCWTRAVLAAASLFATAPGFATEPEAPTALGPDVTIIYMGNSGDTQSISSAYGPVGGIRAYAFGTTSCNIGDQPVNWCNDLEVQDEDGNWHCNSGLRVEQHPVIAQNLYRLKDGRFEQIGMSWLKHGYLSTNTTDSNCKMGHPTCTDHPLGGDQLGVGCTDTYGSSLNGTRPLGMRSEVNSTTGAFPYPYTEEPFSASIDQRVQVPETDLDPALNSGASYWIEGQYVSDNDAQSGNGLNNASYRKVAIGSLPNLTMTVSGSTVRERTAIYGWGALDPTVVVKNVDIAALPVTRFEVGLSVTPIDATTWHYEYVIRNMNSDRSARAFSIDFPDGTSFANVGFNDIEHHSGESYATTDWTANVNEPTSVISWSTETFATNPNANALRWGTMFNFWFDALRQPGTVNHTITLFKPGSPASVSFAIDLFSDGFESGGTGGWSSVGG